MNLSLCTDLMSNILYNCDISTLVACSGTNKAARKNVAVLLNQQFANLLAYCEINIGNYSLPTLEKRIYANWTAIKSEIDFEGDCFILKKIGAVFHLLKMFYGVLPEYFQQEVLHVNCPAFIHQMTGSDASDVLWESRYIQVSYKLHDLLFELNKLGLVEQKSNLQKQFDKLPYSEKPWSVFLKEEMHPREMNPWKHSVSVVSYSFSGPMTSEIWPGIEPGKNTKWECIKFMYRSTFCTAYGTSIWRQELRVPLNDLILKKEQSGQVRDQIFKMAEFKKKMTRKDTANLSPFGYCLRYSADEKDCFGRLEIVLSVKSAKGKLSHVILKTDNLTKLSQFKLLVEESLQYTLTKKTVLT